MQSGTRDRRRVPVALWGAGFVLVMSLAYGCSRDGSAAPRSCAELLALPADPLAEVDVVRMNLLCAEGLPGAEGIKTDEALAVFEPWARKGAE